MIDVAVVGSLHLDIMVGSPRLPLRDETLIGTSWRYKCGGKGGNQAVAAALAGARTAFAGRVGNDDFGVRLRGNLAAAGVDISCVGLDTAHGSGMSVAIEEAGGEYCAVVVSGANMEIDAGAAAAEWASLWKSKVLLLQNEIPEAVNIAAARAMKLASGLVVLNAAPARAMSDVLLGLVDVLIVNRVEAEMLTGIAAATPAEAELAAASLATAARDAIVTLGKDGLVLRTREGEVSRIAATPVRVRSSHGAGDCFCGTLAAHVSKGAALAGACHHASAAAASLVSSDDMSAFGSMPIARSTSGAQFSP
jgi:ribokinase